MDARALGLDPARSPVAELAAGGAALVEAARPTLRLRHPDYGPVGPLSFALFVDAAREPVADDAFPIAAYVHPGVICHSPSGTGTSAVLAWLAAHGRIAAGGSLATVSPEGGSFTGRLLGATRVGRHRAVRTEIRGWPRRVGARRVVVDADEPLLGVDARALLVQPA